MTSAKPPGDPQGPETGQEPALAPVQPTAEPAAFPAGFPWPMAPDPDRPAQPAVPSAGVGAETASSPTPAEDEPPTITADTDSGGGR